MSACAWNEVMIFFFRTNVNFVHEVYRQAFLLSFSYSPAMKKVNIMIYIIVFFLGIDTWIIFNINIFKDAEGKKISGREGT